MANQVPLITEVSSVENCAALSANTLVILQRRASKENPVLAIILAQLAAQQAAIAEKLAEIKAVMQ